jgi:hypothetical protein
MTDEKKKLFKAFGKLFLACSRTDEVLICLQCLDKTRKLTVDTRIVDQGQYLLPAARAKLAPQGITVQTQSMGKSSREFERGPKADIHVILQALIP